MCICSLYFFKKKKKLLMFSSLFLKGYFRCCWVELDSTSSFRSNLTIFIEQKCWCLWKKFARFLECSVLRIFFFCCKLFNFLGVQPSNKRVFKFKFRKNTGNIQIKVLSVIQILGAVQFSFLSVIQIIGVTYTVKLFLNIGIVFDTSHYCGTFFWL